MNATYSEPLSDALPISYALLVLPPKAEMKRKGYDPQLIMTQAPEKHPLAIWKKFSLPASCTYKKAVHYIQEANNNEFKWGLLKARLNFSDGRQEIFARHNPFSPDSFELTGSYDPNGVYRNETLHRSLTNKAKLEPRLKPLVNESGHHLSGKPIPRTFAPEVLYKNCPPPVHSQAGYDFTPMSYNAFALKPKEPLDGARDVQSNFMHKSCDYRPRYYSREAIKGMYTLKQGTESSNSVSCDALVNDKENTNTRVQINKNGNTTYGNNDNSIVVGSANNSLQSNSYHKCNEPMSGIGKDSRHCHCSEVYQVGDYTLDLSKEAAHIDHRNRVTHFKTTKLGTEITPTLIVGKRNVRVPRFPDTSADKLINEHDAVAVNETVNNSSNSMDNEIVERNDEFVLHIVKY